MTRNRHTCHPPHLDPCEQEAAERALARWTEGVICDCGLTVYGPLEADAYLSEAAYEDHTIECGDCAGQWHYRPEVHPVAARREVQEIQRQTRAIRAVRAELVCELAGVSP